MSRNIKIKEVKKQYNDENPWTKEQIDLFLRGKNSSTELKLESICDEKLKTLIATDIFKYLSVRQMMLFFSGLIQNRNVYLWKGPETNLTEQPLNNGQEFWRQIKDVKPALQKQIVDCMANAQPTPIAIQDWQILDYPTYNELRGIPCHSLDLTELDLTKSEGLSALVRSVDPNAITDVRLSLYSQIDVLPYILKSFPQLKMLRMSNVDSYSLEEWSTKNIHHLQEYKIEKIVIEGLFYDTLELSLPDNAYGLKQLDIRPSDPSRVKKIEITLKNFELRTEPLILGIENSDTLLETKGMISRQQLEPQENTQGTLNDFEMVTIQLSTNDAKNKDTVIEFQKFIQQKKFTKTRVLTFDYGMNPKQSKEIFAQINKTVFPKLKKLSIYTSYVLEEKTSQTITLDFPYLEFLDINDFNFLLTCPKLVFLRVFGGTVLFSGPPPEPPQSSHIFFQTDNNIDAIMAYYNDAENIDPPKIMPPENPSSSLITHTPETKDNVPSPAHILNSTRSIIDPFVEDQKQKTASGKNHSISSDLKESDLKKSDLEESDLEKAANYIQLHWRMFKIFKEFLANGYLTYLKLLGNQEIDELARLMFGRTISSFSTLKNEFITAGNPYPHDKINYNRTDEFNSGLLMNSLIERFGENLNPTYQYIPYLRMENLSVSQTLNIVDKEDDIKTLTKDNYDQLAILKILKKGPSSLKKVAALKTFGAIGSPFALSIAKLKLCESKKTGDVPDFIHIPKAPDDFSGLQSSIDQLSRIVLSQLPTRYLAKFLQNLLNSLKKYPAFDFDKKIIQRMYFFLFCATHFSQKSYERFGLCVYAIIHELSLILYANQEKIEKEKFYQQFVEATFGNFSYFGLEEKKLTDSDLYERVVIPAASGCNAFLIAIELIKRIAPETGKLRMFTKKPFYYENDNVFPFLRDKIDNIREDGIEENTNPYKDIDIVYFSAGPICEGREHYLGSDINFIIKKIIEQNSPLKKHVILLIDATTSLYSKLKISSEYTKYFTSGLLTAIFFESFVKFRMGHSERAHGGRVIAICSKKIFKDVLGEFVQNGQKDLAQHFDMLVCAYLQIYAKNLEKLKEMAFRNGGIYNKIVLSSPQAQSAMIPITSDEKETNLNDRYFLCYALPDVQERIKIRNYLVPQRDSFGHFVTTSTGMGSATTYERISPNASDELDSLINSTAIYLHSTYQTLQFIQCLAYFYITLGTQPTNIKDSVILLSMALVLIGNENEYTRKTYIGLPLLIKAILHLINSSLIGRYPYTRVYRYTQNNYKYSLKGKSNHVHKIAEQLLKHEEAKAVVLSTPTGIEITFPEEKPNLLLIKLNDEINAFDTLKKLINDDKFWQGKTGEIGIHASIKEMRQVLGKDADIDKIYQNLRAIADKYSSSHDGNSLLTQMATAVPGLHQALNECDQLETLTKNAKFNLILTGQTTTQTDASSLLLG